MTIEDLGLTGRFWRDVALVAKEIAAIGAIIALGLMLVLVIYAAIGD